MSPSWLNKCLFFASALLAVSFPIYPMLVQISVLILLLFYLLPFDWKRRFHELKSSKLALLLILFFLLNVVGLLWSENMEKGILHIEIKFSLLLMPLLVFSRPELSENWIKKIKLYFVGSAAIVALFLLSRSFLIGYLNSGSWLVYGEFSPFFHPSYISMYFLLAMVFLLDKERLSINSKIVYYTSIFSLGTSVFFLASKLNILLLFLILLFYFIRYIKVRFSRVRIYILGFMFFLGTISALWLNQSVYDRFAKGWETIMNPEAIQTDDTESNAARLMIWRSAIDLVWENPLGVGTGDVNIELSKKYQENGYVGIESKQLNAHNQFLQTSAAIGILGMLVLFLLLLIPFIQSLMSKDFVFAGFLFITFSNALVEGILEAQAGVIFFAFFYSLFLRNAKSN
jgi:O-antigen ligase